MMAAVRIKDRTGSKLRVFIPRSVVDAQTIVQARRRPLPAAWLAWRAEQFSARVHSGVLLPFLTPAVRC